MSVVLFVCVVVLCVLYYLLSYIILQKRHCEIIAHCPLDKLMHIEVITDISPFIHVVFIIYRSVIIFILLFYAGQEDYDRLRPLSYPDTDVILMCFSVDNSDSLENIQSKWLPEVEHFCPNVPFLLIATKKDLRSDPAFQGVTIKPEAGRNMADTVGAYFYLECSAKTREGVREVFTTATRAALQKKKKGGFKCQLL